MGRQRGWWFEQAVEGTVLHHPGGRTVTPDEHARLAWLTDNASDVHGDAHRAGAGPWGRPLVLGALTAAIVVGLAEPAVGPPDDAARGRARGWTRIELVGAVSAGDTLSAASMITARMLDPDERGGFVQRVVEGRNQHGAVVVRIEDLRWAPRRAPEQPIVDIAT
jgi:acyl dehydratase